MATHYSINDILEVVDKKKIEEEFGGDFLFNEAFQAILDKYFTVGQIKARFFGDKKAEKDPSLAYYRDAMWLQWQEVLNQRQMMEIQQEQIAMAQDQGGSPGQSGPPQAGNVPENGGGKEGNGEPNQQAVQPEGEELDLSRGIDQLIGTLSKSEKQLDPSKRRLLAQHRAVVNKILNQWEIESEAVLSDILKETKKFTNKGKKRGKTST